MTHTILALKAEHTPAIAELARRIWPVSYAGILTPRQIDNLLTRIYNEAALIREMESGQVFWGAYDSDTLVGYASAHKEDKVIWLKKLYVLPQLQKQGIGKLLLRSAINGLSPAAELKLLINRNNIPGMRFYERSGFKRVGEQPVQMGDFKFVDVVFSKGL